MKILYLNCAMGAAGDMLAAALLELHPDPEGFLRRLNSALPDRVTVSSEPDEKRGVRGTRLRVAVDGEEEGREQGGLHPETSVREILDRVRSVDVPEPVRGDVLAVYDRIVRAESAVHGRPVDNVHLHELGSLDALADVLSVCWLVRELSPEKIVCSPIAVGSGTVSCAHGILPVPAPATALLLQGLELEAGPERGELCTPTGAALLGYYADCFGPLPRMRLEKLGVGAGTKDFQTANVLRAFLGESREQARAASADARPASSCHPAVSSAVPPEDRHEASCCLDDCGGEDLLEISCCLDDCSGEEIGFALERLFEAGALDAFTVPIGMKKNRPGVMLTVLCKPDQEAELTRCLFRHTTTLGVRSHLCKRLFLSRASKTVESSAGPIRVKESWGFGVRREKPEFEDLARVARELGISLREASSFLVERS